MVVAGTFLVDVTKRPEYGQRKSRLSRSGAVVERELPDGHAGSDPWCRCVATMPGQDARDYPPASRLLLCMSYA